MTQAAGLPLAVLETSFWVAAYKGEIAATILDFFALMVPPLVEAEIMHTPAAFPGREFSDQTLFRHLRPQMQSAPADLPAPLAPFGPGEAQAIALAAHLRAQGLTATLLINESKGAEYARNISLSVVTAPALVVALRARGVLSDRACRVKLERMAPITPASYLRDAERVLDMLQNAG